MTITYWKNAAATSLRTDVGMAILDRTTDAGDKRIAFYALFRESQEALDLSGYRPVEGSGAESCRLSRIANNDWGDEG